MNSYYHDDEPFISTEGAIGTAVVHILLFLLLFYFGLKAVIPPPEEQGILINFGTADAGFGDVQPVSEDAASNYSEATAVEASAAEQPKTQQPNPILENEAKTSANDQAPMLPIEDRKKSKEKEEVTDKKNQETPKNDNKPKSDKAQENKPQNTNPPKPSVDPRALFPGTTGNNATTQGNQNNSSDDMGKIMGKVDISDNTGDESPGMGDAGVGVSLTGRKLMGIKPIQDSSQEVGKVVIKIRVDRTGKVIDAQFQSGGSTTTSSTLKNKALEAAKSAEFNQTLSGPEIQTGTITFTFKVR
ncbi:MAG TPA: TonB family protein [Chitinophagales bacterium]|nr:TonB family protein [Chitinophagales bacterium]HRK28695.1 TonB family protein [Chitinophagales bacterium]